MGCDVVSDNVAIIIQTFTEAMHNFRFGTVFL